MLSASNPTSAAGRTLRTLALSSASLVCLEPRLRPKYERALEARDGLGARDSFWWFAESAKESWVVALETRFGLPMRTECDVEGRDSRRPRLGRGGSGGGVPSLDTVAEAWDKPDVDGFLDRLSITLSVGFAKSCCTTLSVALGAGEGGALDCEPSDSASDCDGSAEGGSVMSTHSSEVSDMAHGVLRTAS
jgi:hypothetical protein